MGMNAPLIIVKCKTLEIPPRVVYFGHNFKMPSKVGPRRVLHLTENCGVNTFKST